VLIASYDGGQIGGIGAATIPAEGTVPFTFQSGGGPGIYRVLVQVGDEQHLVQFRVNPPGE
jgi:hypothetical protein